MENSNNKTGRKPKPVELKKRAHQVYATDAEWALIERLAALAGSEVSPFIIQKALRK